RPSKGPPGAIRTTHDIPNYLRTNDFRGKTGIVFRGSPLHQEGPKGRSPFPPSEGASPVLRGAHPPALPDTHKLGRPTSRCRSRPCSFNGLSTSPRGPVLTPQRQASQE